LIGQPDRLQKQWDSPIYVFFKSLPLVEYIKDRKAHAFICAATQCRGQTRSVRRFLDKSDAKSTSNMHRHAKVCWGVEAIEAADGTQDKKAALRALENLETNNGSIVAAFQQVGERKPIYNLSQHTKTKARYAWPICTFD